ncbi:hypothetical protein C4564_01025 [Candidatus Microgenomates bacterium]|nr:MAG: hypothetical protein C4564_01025 [Candidatus Microgenomates bacterium]
MNPEDPNAPFTKEELEEQSRQLKELKPKSDDGLAWLDKAKSGYDPNAPRRTMDSGQTPVDHARLIEEFGDED